MLLNIFHYGYITLLIYSLYKIISLKVTNKNPDVQIRLCCECLRGMSMNTNDSRSGGAVDKSVRTAKARFGVRIQAATALSRKNR